MFHLGGAIFGQVEAKEALKKIYSWMQRRKETVTELGEEQDLPLVGSQDHRREEKKPEKSRASRCHVLGLSISFSNKSVWEYFSFYK